MDCITEYTTKKIATNNTTNHNYVIQPHRIQARVEIARSIINKSGLHNKTTKPLLKSISKPMQTLVLL